MKHLILFTLILLSVNVYSQEQFSTLKVTGEAFLNVRPTQTVVTFSLSETKMSYDESIEGLSSRVNLLNKSLLKSGFKKEAIKTSNFNIRKNIVYDKGKQEDKGFITSQTVRVTFQDTKEQLIKVLNATTSSKADASIQISFELTAEDKKRHKEELITMAVTDARAKAELIVDAADYTIAGINTINYTSFGEGRPPIAYRNTAMMESSTGIANIEAADLLLQERVDIEFIIEKK